MIKTYNFFKYKLNVNPDRPLGMIETYNKTLFFKNYYSKRY